jgi:beta-glucanase (GH16 family)
MIWHRGCEEAVMRPRTAAIVFALVAAACGSTGDRNQNGANTPVGSGTPSLDASTSDDAGAPISNEGDASSPGDPDASSISDAGVSSSADGSDASEPGWQLTWSDEFNAPDGSAVDPTKWGFDTGGSGWGNQELEYYTSGTANAVIENGALVITATPVGASSYSCWNGPCQYTSARLNTSGKFSQQYGRFEARIRIPEGQGVWPAFWLLGENIGTAGWPACGEIDIMENIGSTPDTTYGTTHGPGPGSYPDDGLSGPFDGGVPMGNAFHVYATEWSAASVSFYVDGTLYWTVTPSQLPSGATWVWNQPFFILLNFAVGGSWPGSPNASTSWPQQMIVDYVRVYQPE